MKKLLFIIHVFTLLLSGIEVASATERVSEKNTSFSHPKDFSIKQDFLIEKSNILFTSVLSDFFWDEEYSSNSERQDSQNDKVLKQKQSSLIQGYLFNYFSKRTASLSNFLYYTKPINRQSTPIYLTQRSLRI